MSRIQRVRETLSSPLTMEYLNERTAGGWRITALEWERDVPDEDSAPDGWTEDLPYGLQVSDDCTHLVENSAETEIIAIALDRIVDDHPLSSVAEELNRQGYRTRSGGRWTPTILFNLLPRMIEVGPRLFASRQWTVRRQRA